LCDAHLTTPWQGVSDEFVPGIMIHKWDEIWSAVLTGFTYTDWFPATLSLLHFGNALHVNVSDVRTMYAEGYTQPLARLNLPYDTRMRVATVFGVDHDANVRPELPCDGVQFVADGQEIPTSVVRYDGRAKVLGVDIDAGAQGWENIDLDETTFARERLQFGATHQAKVIGGYTC
jgi:hypothetical protein